MKKLRRSRENSMLTGVLGGLGEYLGIDPTVLRLLVAVLCILTVVFPILLIYLAAAVIIPADDERRLLK